MVERFRERIKPDVTKVRQNLLWSVASRVECFGEDIEKELAAMAEQYKMDVDKLEEVMGDQGVHYIKQDIRNRKAIDLMYESAVVEG